MLQGCESSSRYRIEHELICSTTRLWVQYRSITKDQDGRTLRRVKVEMDIHLEKQN